ncbi:MAG: YraN family protein [Bryobacteraceae bacterium]|nr:YraN family protein [Bryobacteraceae bacterium]
MLSLLYRTADALRHYRRRRRWQADQALGRRGEDLAHRYLRERGFIVVARNHRARSGIGELDIVARDGEMLVFVEVKSRRTDEFGSPDRAIDPDKRDRLLRAARDYVRRSGADWKQVRFDVINVVFTEPPSITHLRDVFHVTTAPFL